MAARRSRLHVSELALESRRATPPARGQSSSPRSRAGPAWSAAFTTRTAGSPRSSPATTVPTTRSEQPPRTKARSPTYPAPRLRARARWRHRSRRRPRSPCRRGCATTASRTGPSSPRPRLAWRRHLHSEFTRSELRGGAMLVKRLDNHGRDVESLSAGARGARTLRRGRSTALELRGALGLEPYLDPVRAEYRTLAGVELGARLESSRAGPPASSSPGAPRSSANLSCRRSSKPTSKRERPPATGSTLPRSSSSERVARARTPHQRPAVRADGLRALGLRRLRFHPRRTLAERRCTETATVLRRAAIRRNARRSSRSAGWCWRSGSWA